MRSLTIALCMFLSFGCGKTVAAQASPPNWKQVWHSKVSSVDAAWFYDSSNLRRPSDRTVRAWVKALRVKDVEKEIRTDRAVADRIRDLEDKLEATQTTQTLWDLATIELEIQRDVEWIVNSASIEPLMVILYELDCRKAMYRGLSIHTKVDGKFRSDDRAEKWHHIAPESLQSTLAQALCDA